MATRVTIELPNGETGWIDISNSARNAVVDYLAENPTLTFAEASEEVLGVDLNAAAEE